MKTSKLFQAVIAAIKAEGIILITSDVKLNDDKTPYVEVKYPSDFRKATGESNAAIDDKFCLIDDPDGIELVLADDPNPGDCGSARNLNELHDYLFVGSESRKKYIDWLKWKAHYHKNYPVEAATFNDDIMLDIYLT